MGRSEGKDSEHNADLGGSVFVLAYCKINDSVVVILGPWWTEVNPNVETQRGNLEDDHGSDSWPR